MVKIEDTNKGSEFWPNFGLPIPEPDEPDLGSVAEQVLAAYNINKENEGGGGLANVDLKRVNAYNALKASLLDFYAHHGGGLREMAINPEGSAEFYEVGSTGANINPYYSIKSSAYLEPQVGVMITGGKPKQVRQLHPWFRLVGEGANCTYHDLSKFKTNCLLSNISTHAVVTYEDPLRHSGNQAWNNGITEMFEPEFSYERIVGFCWRIIPPSDLVTPYTVIKKQSQSVIPVLIAGDEEYKIGTADGAHPEIGTLVKRNPNLYAGTGNDTCAQFDSEVRYCGDTTVGLNIEIQEGLTYEKVRGGEKVNKFNGVQGLFAVGIPLGRCQGLAKEGHQLGTSTSENTQLFISAPDINRSIVSLNEGVHYATLYKSDDDVEAGDSMSDLPCFQFANNLRYADNAPVGSGVPFWISNNSYKLQELFGLDEGTVELRGRGTILPMEKSSGMLIEQIWAQVVLDTPCFTVIDTAGKAKDIAEKLIVEVMAISMSDPPAPIAVNGEIVDQESGVKDNNPTTAENFEDSDLELAQIVASQGRTLHLNLASLDEVATERLSQALYDVMLADTGETWSHTCPPTDEPELGGRGPNGGIINEIEYSYTDQNNYLINVIEGPEYYGDFAGISGKIYEKQVEEIHTKGTIIQDVGNNTDYKVKVDGMGIIKCVNGSSSILGIRDRVSVALYNNPVEE